MSLAESFFSIAKDLLLATENIKRLEQKIDTMARDMVAIDHRLVHLEA